MGAKVQRGGIIRSNEFGTLERVDGTRTYIGSTTLPDGKVLTKRFRMSGWDEEAIAERWLKWQGRKSDDDDDFEEEEAIVANGNDNEKKNPSCPFSGAECTWTCPLFSVPNGSCSIALGGVGLYNISCNLGLLSSSEAIELVAMAVGELGKSVPREIVRAEEPVETPVKTVADGVEAYLSDKTFLAFVNLHSKTVYSPYKRFCEERGYPAETESNFTKAVKARYPELKANRQAGGCVFVAA